MAFRSTALVNKNLINMKEIEERVEKAKRQKKIFMIIGGEYEIIRQSLLAREWIEKVTERQLSLLNPTSEASMLALAARNHPHHFIWQPRTRPVQNAGNVTPYVSSIIRKPPLNFTSKDGLENIVKNYRWFHEDDLTELSCQRSHILVDKTSRNEFSEDFRRTAFTSFMLFLHEHLDFETLFTASEEAISTECIDFTCQKVDLIIRMENHDDIETSNLFDVCSKFPRRQNEFLNQIRKIKNGTKKFILEGDTDVIACKSKVSECAKKILNQWPYMKYDGYNNIWIMKPIGHSSGNGVQAMDNEEKILKESRESRSSFVVQKYIEKPLIIHQRKFDIRIYLLTFIRDGFVDVWLYRDCYVKFSTPVFTLDNLHRSVHVTNYAVQKHFMNPQDLVPNAMENMWPLSELLKYFESIEKHHVWQNLIFPGIKKNILAVVSASLECTEMTTNNFELNGADFMIGSDFKPILIEINSVPALYFSKVVVEMITKKLLEDVIRVVVDRQRDPEALTGSFELIHSFQIPTVAYELADLSIDGKKIESYSARVRSQPENESEKNTQRIDTSKNTNTMQRFSDRNQVHSIYFRENVSS